MDFVKLNYFVEAANVGSFTQAAERLYTSQPNISKQISALETELDVKLFIRHNRSVQLTRAGEYLYNQIKDLPRRLELTFETTRALHRGDTGNLTIGLLAGQSLHGDIISGLGVFAQKHPELKYTLERSGFSALRTALRSFKYDLIITLSFDVEADEDIAWETLKPQTGALFVSRMGPMSDLTGLEDISRAPFIAISPEESPGGFRQLVGFCQERGFTPNIVRIADSLDSLLFYVEAGQGVTILDRNTRLESDRNIRVIPVPESKSANVVAVWLKSNPNPNIHKLLECLKGEGEPPDEGQ